LQDALQAISDEVTDLLSDSKLGRIGVPDNSFNPTPR
jgi:hypothetical protein